mgnify:FL=1
MISDVLSDAADEIRAYLRTHAAMYVEVKPRLEKLLSDMDGLREELDTPPDPPAQRRVLR